MGKLTTTDLAVLMDDGTEHIATIDQRDYARWEAAPENVPDRPLDTLRLRYLAWAALKRTGVYAPGFVRFNTVDCVQVGATDEAMAELEAEEEGKAQGS